MDLHWARLIDDEDLDSDAREDMMDYGDTQYPYLVTSLERALATLAQRAPLLVARFGTDVAPIVDNFARHLRLHYGPYVLCRTSGLPDVEAFGPELQKALEDFEALTRSGDAASDNVIVADINHTRTMLRPDRMHLLTGHSHDFTQAEPEPEVVDVVLPVDAEVAEPARVTQSARASTRVAADDALVAAVKRSADRASGWSADQSMDRAAGRSADQSMHRAAGRSANQSTDRAAGHAAETSAAARGGATANRDAATARSQQPARRENKLVGWLVAVAVGVPTVLAYQTTRSVWISGILFLLLCAAAGWFMKRRA
ncbi:hypothetical protein [Pigmentiphaga litoralis]|uniref:hypothetical protein n=1 Tax=Pigmentiphaga litoralis TaxID=516702 RepID=UPI003B42E229